MVACRYGISLLVLNSKRNSISTRAYVSCSPSPTPYPIREKVRQYNHNFSLELPHCVYISIRLKYSLQKFGLVYVNYVNEQKNRDNIVPNKTKTLGAKNTFKHYALNIAYCLWILYDLGSAIWLGDTPQSPNRVLAERRRVDSYKSCN